MKRYQGYGVSLPAKKIHKPVETCFGKKVEERDVYTGAKLVVDGLPATCMGRQMGLLLCKIRGVVCWVDPDKERVGVVCG